MTDRNRFTDRPKCCHTNCSGRDKCAFTGQDLRKPKCRWGNGEHGPCGGPSNGRECWDHRFVGREDMQ